MAVHVPLSVEAQAEAREIMASDKNILKPGNGEPVVSAKLLDVIFGVYWMTKDVKGEKGEGKIFPDQESAFMARNYGAVAVHAKIKILAPETPKFEEFKGQVFETTIGRLLFNSVLPVDYPYINKVIDKKAMAKIIDGMMVKYGISEIPMILDKIKSFGFKYTTFSGVTWGIDDVLVPDAKKEIVERAKNKEAEVQAQFEDGLLSNEERRRIVIEMWHGTKNEMEKEMPASLDQNGPVHDLVKSGARGSIGNIVQMAGLKGLIQNTAGETIEFPIISSMKEGLTPIEYFITTHGSRKGLTDTALNTAKAGYLTRRLFDVAQDVVIREDDCGTKDYISLGKENILGIEVSVSKNIRGRYLAADVLDDSGKVIYKKGYLLTKEDANRIEELNIKNIAVRSPLTCKSFLGICAKCYGADLGKGVPISIGEAVGTVAAQAIGEPGTQLTMRTFHAGGTASVGGDITQGLPRVEEVFEKRKPKNPAIVVSVDGTVSEIKEEGKEKIIKVIADVPVKGKSEVEYVCHYKRMALVKVGDKVKKGDIITDGSADIDDVFKNAGKDYAEKYVISEVAKLYELQGETVSRKHIEVIVRQMFSRRKIKSVGDTSFAVGEIVDPIEFYQENEIAKNAGKEEAKGDVLVMGITEVSLSRRSFLSAASFQHTTRILINSAIHGTVDRLSGLKENVIIGRLIPAGTGYKGSPKYEMIKEIQRKNNIETGE